MLGHGASPPLVADVPSLPPLSVPDVRWITRRALSFAAALPHHARHRNAALLAALPAAPPRPPPPTSP